MRIQHNIMAMNAYRNYNNNTSALSKNLEKLSSGYKINRAGDDAAGLAISEKMRAQITGLDAAQKNVKDGISLVKTAEGAMQEIHDMLNRMDYLATQSANGTYDNEVDRYNLQKEVNQLKSEINRIADSANFNGIKLLDGSLSGANITTDGMEVSQIDMANGVDVVQGSNGGGSHGTFTINVDSAFSTGDQLQLKFGGLIADTTANGGNNKASLTLTYNTDFSGNTLEEQASSIAKKLKSDSDVASRFDIDVKGTAVTLTAKVEGSQLSKAATDTDTSNVTSTVTEVKLTDTGNLDRTWDATAGRTKGTNGTAKNDATIDTIIDDGSGTGMDITDGDVLDLTLQLTDGKEVTVSVTAGKDFEIGKETKDTLANLATALNNANLSDNKDTVIDESKLVLSDLVKLAVDSDTGLKATTVDGAFKNDAAMKLTNNRSGKTLTGTAGADSAGTKNNVTLTLTGGTASGTLPTGTTAATNLAIGDKMTFKGELGDGRTFEFEIEAGKDFKVDKAAYTAAVGTASTMNNIKTLLESDGFEIKLSDGSTVKGSDIFGDNAEIKITANDGKFESIRPGSKGAVQLTEVKLTAGDATSVSSTLKNGDQKTSADSTITLSEGVSYGAVVEVGGKKYELVKSANDVSSSGNKAVIVDDISDIDAAARSLASSIKEDLNDSIYKVSASNGTVTVATKKVGSAAQAISASASGDKTTQIEFTLDPSKMKAGSTVTINGQTYEFVNKGDNASDKSYEKIEVANFAKETASSLGGQLQKLANGKNNASVTMDENGKITVRGMADADNKIVTPSVKFANGTSGLRLQIGDTADSFNQMNVSIYNMHVADMGIGDINIGTQDGAAEAIDKIKAAINYVSDVRGDLGAIQNRLEHTGNNLSVMQENIQDAESTIRDTDVAAEMMSYVKNNILVQSAQAMLAQANQVPQGVLQLLG